MQMTISILRAVHILCGTFWAGTAIFLALFCEPTANALGRDGGRFMQHLTGKTLFPVAMSVSGALTVMAGFGLFYIVFGFSPDQYLSARGIALLCAAAFGTAAAVIGAVILKGTIKKLEALAAQLTTNLNAPTLEQQTMLAALKRRFTRFARVNAVLLALCVLGMSIARYI